MVKNASALFVCALLIFASPSSCRKSTMLYVPTSGLKQNQRDLITLLGRPNLDAGSSFAIVNQIVTEMMAASNHQEAALFLTDWVSHHPEDSYNSYWLLMTAYAYLSMEAEPIAEYYFDRIISEYPDLFVQENSIHYMCLSNLIQISNTPHNRIKYFNELINRFPDKISITELYIRLAIEYEKENEWESAMKAYSLFLDQPDAATIQIPGEPDAYRNARQLVDFNNSAKNWTFESLDALESAVKRAIANYDYRSLDRYKSKVNFFSMSWRQDELDTNSQEEFSMLYFMRGNRISVAKELDEATTPNEVYLRTWGWSQYVSVWYLCFRRVNFPVDPDIHGNWEWVGIYMGERL